MTETPILDESAVSEIEARAGYVNTRFEEKVILTPAERDALCATVKQLRAENQKLMASRRVHELDNHHNALACGYCSGPLKDELTRLAQVEQERDRLKEAVSEIAIKKYDEWAFGQCQGLAKRTLEQL